MVNDELLTSYRNLVEALLEMIATGNHLVMHEGTDLAVHDYVSSGYLSADALRTLVDETIAAIGSCGGSDDHH